MDENLREDFKPRPRPLSSDDIVCPEENRVPVASVKAAADDYREDVTVQKQQVQQNQKASSKSGRKDRLPERKGRGGWEFRKR